MGEAAIAGAAIGGANLAATNILNVYGRIKNSINIMDEKVAVNQELKSKLEAFSNHHELYQAEYRDESTAAIRAREASAHALLEEREASAVRAAQLRDQIDQKQGNVLIRAGKRIWFDPYHAQRSINSQKRQIEKLSAATKQHEQRVATRNRLNDANTGGTTNDRDTATIDGVRYRSRPIRDPTLQSILASHLNPQNLNPGAQEYQSSVNQRENNRSAIPWRRQPTTTGRPNRWGMNNLPTSSFQRDVITGQGTWTYDHNGQEVDLVRRTRLAYEEAEDRAYESSDSLEDQQHNRPESALAEIESFVSCSNSQQTSQSRTRATHATNSDADDLHLSQSMQGMSINQRNELDSTYASYEDLAEGSPGRQRHNQQAQQVVAICGYEPPGADGYMRMQYGDMFELVESLEYWWLLRCPRTGTVGYVPGDYVAPC